MNANDKDSIAQLLLFLLLKSELKKKSDGDLDRSTRLSMTRMTPNPCGAEKTSTNLAIPINSSIRQMKEASVAPQRKAQRKYSRSIELSPKPEGA